MAYTEDYIINAAVGAKNLITIKGASLPSPFWSQGDVIPMTVQLVKPDPLRANTFVIQNVAAMSLKFQISDDQSGSTPLVNQFTWTLDAPNNRFSANVAMNTAALTTFMSTGTSGGAKQAYAEWEFTEGSTILTSKTIPVTIKKELISSATTAIAAGLTPLSREEALQMFPQFVMRAGDTITFLSPDGTRQRILGVDNNGTGTDYII